MALETKVPVATDILFPVLSFVGGMNTRSSLSFLSGSDKFSMKPDELASCDNVRRTSSGAMQTRDGRTKLNATPVAPAAGDATIRSIFELRTSAGVNRIFINAGGTVYYYNTGTGAFTLVTAALTANARVHWCQFQNIAIGVNGVDTPFKISSTPTYTVLIGTPPAAASAVCAYRNRVWMINGQTLSYCALGNQDDWTTANNAGSLPIPTSAGRGGTALFPFWDRLEVFTNDQVFEVVGTGPSDFQLRAVNHRYGHQATPHSVLAAGNEVYFANNRGLHQLSTTLSQSDVGELTVTYASAIIEPTWQGISPTNIPNIMIGNDINNNQLIILCSTTGATNLTALIADYYHLDDEGRPTWSRWTNYPFASIMNVSSLSEIPEVLLGGYDGYVYKQGSAYETDDGAVIPISGQYVTDLGNPSFMKTFRYILLLAQSLGANTQIILNVSSDFGFHVISQTVDITQPQGDIIGSTFTIGVSSLGTLTYYPRLIPIPAFGRFLTVNFSVSNARRVTIGGMVFYAGYRRAIGI